MAEQPLVGVILRSLFRIGLEVHLKQRFLSLLVKALLYRLYPLLQALKLLVFRRRRKIQQQDLRLC
jgi:hypothetical protein